MEQSPVSDGTPQVGQIEIVVFNSISSQIDAVTLFVVLGLVGIVALISAGIPAWRAASTDPQASLRCNNADKPSE